MIRVQHPFHTPKKESPTVEAWEMLALLCELCTVALVSKACYDKKQKPKNKILNGVQSSSTTNLRNSSNLIFEGYSSSSSYGDRNKLENENS